MYQVDLNCDCGESFGDWPMGRDAELLPLVTSANIACGFHAGDPVVMQRTIALAMQHGVAIGAHPGFPDLQGFGRRNMQLSATEVYDMVMYQISALQGMVQAAGGVLHHVKPHGALYNMAAKDKQLATAIAQAVASLDQKLMLYGLSGSAIVEAGLEAGLRTCSEVFADRRYEADGSLRSRRLPDALITDPQEAAQQALDMVLEGKIKAIDGREVSLKAETICLHGDGAHAVELAKEIVCKLRDHGVQIANLSAQKT